MGKGDKKTARGKIWRGSYGTSRPHHPGKAKPKIPVVVTKKKKKYAPNSRAEKPQASSGFSG